MILFFHNQLVLTDVDKVDIFLFFALFCPFSLPFSAFFGGQSGFIGG